MRSHVKKLPPALKHAGYSALTILPGESAAEFEKLHRDLIAAYTPIGPDEDAIVAKMARVLWRSQNLETFRIAELARARCEQIRREKIPEDKLDFPFPLLGSVTPVDPAKREAGIRAAEDQIRKELGELCELVELGEVATVDSLIKDLEVQERLDAVFDRCVKRLLMVKGLKSISNVPSSAPPKRLAGPSKAA
jgi:hypothetical protein